MSKSKSKTTLKLDEILRIQVKEGYDPLMQFTSNEKNQEKANQFNSPLSDPIHQNEKNYIEEKLLGK